MPFGWPQVLVFGDIMADLAYYLRGSNLLDDVAVVTDLRRHDRGSRSLLIDRSGGRRDRLFDLTYLIFEARGEDYDDAYDIAQSARGLLWSAPKSIAQLVHVEDVAGPMRLLDEANEELFYRFGMRFKVRGTPPQG